MSEKSKRFKTELDQLIGHGEQLFNTLLFEYYPEQFELQVTEKLGKEKADQIIEELPNFSDKYQTWYSEALALVRQTLPDRLRDFISYYEYPRVRKEISFSNYMIRDYLQGLKISRGVDRQDLDGRSAIPEFEQQLNILKAAGETLDSSLIDLKLTLQADLFDTELDSAHALAKTGLLRASGAICGVVIEKHLKQVCVNHGIVVRKKNPTISDLNQVLKKRGVISIPQWRFVQHLADIRNICDHDKGVEPQTNDLDDLLSGTGKILKTIF